MTIFTFLVSARAILGRSGIGLKDNLSNGLSGSLGSVEDLAHKRTNHVVIHIGKGVPRIRIIIAFFIAALGIGIYAKFVRDLSAARARLIGRSKRIETSSGSIEYVVAGEGEPVLIIHGAGGGFDQGLDMTGALAVHGYRLIVPSRFGYLSSALPANPTAAMQAGAYAELLDNLGIKKVAVLAISAGEWSALQFAIRYPQRCRLLVLVVPANYLPPNKRNYGGPLARLIFRSDFIAWTALKLTAFIPALMAEMMLGTKPALLRAAEPKEKSRVRQVLDHLLPIKERSAGMLFDIKASATPEPYQLTAIACPVLTISAEDDVFGTAVRAKYVADNVPNGQKIVYPSGGHALIGRQDEITHEVTSFLAHDAHTLARPQNP